MCISTKIIKERIHKAQYDAFKSVNKELINLYWDIGRSIVAKQEKLGWGKSIVITLARDLQHLDSYNLNLREYLSDFKFQIFLARFT
jgi:hypothetical protein